MGFHIITKCCSSIASQSRSEHRFKIQEFGPDSHIIINSINAFIQSVEFSNKDPIRIGICGVNNVGKTSISNEVRRILSNRFDVRLFTDAFRIASNDTSTEKNYSTLFLQLIDESILEREVCIYDRTTLDNFCFLCLRAGKDNNLYNVLAPSIAVSMKKFDLIVHVRKSDEDYSKKTKYVTGSERKLIGQMLDDFFRVYGIDKFDVVIDFKEFDQSSRMWAEVISKKVVEIYQRLRLAE